MNSLHITELSEDILTHIISKMRSEDIPFFANTCKFFHGFYINTFNTGLIDRYEYRYTSLNRFLRYVNELWMVLDCKFCKECFLCMTSEHSYNKMTDDTRFHLERAVETGCVEIMDYIRNGRAKVKDGHWLFKPITKAIDNGRVNSLKWLLKYGGTFQSIQWYDVGKSNNVEIYKYLTDHHEKIVNSSFLKLGIEKGDSLELYNYVQKEGKCLMLSFSNLVSYNSYRLFIHTITRFIFRDNFDEVVYKLAIRDRKRMLDYMAKEYSDYIDEIREDRYSFYAEHLPLSMLELIVERRDDIEEKDRNRMMERIEEGIEIVEGKVVEEKGL